MVYALWEDASNYLGLSEGIKKGLQFLLENELPLMQTGRYEIDGDNVYATISAYQTKNSSEAELEAHTKYIDLQYIISGEEVIKCGFLRKDSKLNNHFPEKDIAFYQGVGTGILMNDKVFMILFPNDLHAPCISVNEQKPSQIKKIVVKIRV